MRSDVAHSALSNDMFLQASADQGELTNVHTPRKQIGQPPCPYCGGGSLEDGGDDEGGQAGGGSSESTGCNTTGSLDDSGVTLALLLGAGGFVAVRARRRRKSR
jgi:MYXO-CTERM domain-containing protein